jgi:hypothetical protein
MNGMIPLQIYERSIDDRPTRARRRIDIERTRREHQRMSSLNLDIEHQIHAINARRLKDIMQAQQLREARIDRPSRLRAAIADLLIAAGDRLRQQPARPESTANPVKAVRPA